MGQSPADGSSLGIIPSRAIAFFCHHSTPDVPHSLANISFYPASAYAPVATTSDTKHFIKAKTIVSTTAPPSDRPCYDSRLKTPTTSSSKPSPVPSRQVREDRRHTRPPHSRDKDTDLIDRLATFEAGLDKYNSHRVYKTNCTPAVVAIITV